MPKKYSPYMEKYLEYKPDSNVMAYESYEKAYENILKEDINENRLNFDLKDVINVYFKEYGTNAQVNEDGSIMINNNIANISYDEKTKEIVGVPQDITEQRAKDLAERAIFGTIGKENFPEQTDIYLRLSDTINAVNEDPNQKYSFEIKGVFFDIQKHNDNTYEIQNSEKMYSDNGEITVIYGDRLTKEEILSAESIDTIKKAASIAMTIKTDRNIHEELEREEKRDLEGSRTEKEEERMDKFEEKKVEQKIIGLNDKDIIEELTEHERAKTTYSVKGDKTYETGFSSRDAAERRSEELSEYDKYIDALDGIPVTNGPMNSFEDPLEKGDHSFNPYGEDLVNPYFDEEEEPDPHSSDRDRFDDVFSSYY